jgi:serine/threonine protein kinase
LVIQCALLRLIAQGGMGAVYLALRPVGEEEARRRRVSEDHEEVCVVKTVRADLKSDREALGRFLDEARSLHLTAEDLELLLRRLQDPNR